MPHSRSSRALVLSLLLASCAASSADDPPRGAPPAPPPLARDQPPPSSPPSSPPAAAPAEGALAFGERGARSERARYFADSAHDERVAHPDTVLRQPLGSFTAHHHEILAALRAIAATSERVRIAPFGRTHEGRELVQAVIASPENLARIDALRAGAARLADPRGADAAELERLVESAPAIAWLGYSIHGDETSGSDAALAVAWHFAAGTGPDVQAILANVVVVIDPCQNPDGRERILSMFEQAEGYVPSLDAESMRHGRWPFGRGNHYLFDMNRDWIWGTQPETRARWSAISSWHPQLVVDAHEMGAYDTFLFYPAADPFSPHFPAFARAWWPRYAAGQAAAFDRRGWSYYTREWADSWYPGYTDAWATFQGACGILYEQARYGGGAVRKPSGEIATYAEAVERQAESSVANLATLAANRAAVLRDYLAAKQENVAADTPGNERAFVLVPGRDAGRERELLQNLLAQGVEVLRAEEGFTARAVETTLGSLAEREIAPGAWIVPARQPLAPLVKAALAFDPRYDPASLERERKELERKQRSRAYDVTAWSPAHAFDLDGLWCDAPAVRASPAAVPADPTGGVAAPPDPGASVYGWIVDGASDASVAFAARALEAGLRVNLSEEPFRAAGRAFARGSLLVRRHENGPDAAELVLAAARAAGIEAVATNTARSADEGPDLGGQRFALLERPRVALLANAPVGSDDFGHVWHHLDVQVGVPCSQIDAQSFGRADLRRYNVLIVPDGGGSVLRQNAEDLRAWVRSGGTLIAMGGAASAIAEEAPGLSAVRRREDALDSLEAHARAVARERSTGWTAIDAAALWDGKSAAPTPSAPGTKAAEPGGAPQGESGAKPDPAAKPADPAAKPEAKGDEARELDRHAQIFSPQGVILRGECNLDAWITAGCRAELPVYFEGRTALLASPPARAAVRLSTSERLRLSGLLWPEARARIADSAWCTVERRGSGQVILFAAPPAFRGWFRATARLLANAVVYGPGVGADPPARW